MQRAPGSDYYPGPQVKELVHEGRLQTDDDGNVTVMKDGKDVPIIADSQKELVETVADEILSDAPADVRLSGADGGSGAGKGAGGGQPGNGAAEKHQADVEKKYGGQQDDDEKASRLCIS